MSASECLLSWEGVEGENMTYEAQYRKTGTQDYRQVVIKQMAHARQLCHEYSSISLGLQRC